MNINRAVELEEKKLDRDYEGGMIDSQEYNRALNQLHREAREAIREEAQGAYNEVMDRY